MSCFIYQLSSRLGVDLCCGLQLLPIGGLTAVIYTDTLQAFLMVGGALVLMGFCKYDISLSCRISQYLAPMPLILLVVCV